MAVHLVDIPLQGMVKDAQGKRLPPQKATDLLNTWTESGELRARPGVTPFANNPQTTPIHQIINAEFADGSREIVRIDNSRTYSFDGTNWVEVTGARNFTGTNTIPFGWTVALGRLVISNGISADGVWEWDGLAGSRSEITGGVLNDGSPQHKAVRYLATFASRVIGAYTNAANGANIVLGSAPGSTTDWTLANGAFAGVRAEHPSAITGLTADDNTLIVWKERAIVTGIETGDSFTPIFWQLLRTEGVGAIAPYSIVTYGGFHFALSHEGFFVLAGGQPQFIDDEIKRDLFSRISYDALRQARGMVMPEYGKIVWFIPESSDPALSVAAGGGVFAFTAWVYDINTQSWSRHRYPFGISAASRVFIATGDAKVDTFTLIPDHIVDTGIYAGVTVDSFGTGVAAPEYLIGLSGGQTGRLDFAATTDAGTPFAFRWETPDVTWHGQQDDQTGRTVGPLDIVTLDRVEMDYRHSGPNCPIEASISTDGGSTFSTLGSKTLTATVSGYERLAFFGRVSGRQIRLRLSIGSVLGFPKFRNLIMYGSPTGEVR